MTFDEPPCDPAGEEADLRTFYGIVDALKPLTDATENEPIGTLLECSTLAVVAAAMIDQLRAIQRDIKGLHQRKCWPCQTVHWHALNHGPMVACPECGSMDTRLIKEQP